MRDPVCIVLNEREPSKVRAAESLQAALHGLDIDSSRIEVTEDIASTLSAHKPSVVVLDYLLGDITTGLDVLNRLAELPDDRRPTAFFLTDEPSVPVAVEAMRLGALNYYELDNPQAVLKLAREIAHVVVTKRTASGHDKIANSSIALSNLVAQSDASRRLLEQARVLLKLRPPVIAVYGPSGSGKSTLACSLQRAFAALDAPIAKSGQKNCASHHGSFLLKLIDLSLCVDPLSDLLGLHASSIGPRAFFELLAVIDHADADNGELMDVVRTSIAKLPNNKQVQAPLIVCLQSADALRAWKRMIDESHCLVIPALSERARDIPALIQRFSIEAAEISGEKVPQINSELMNWIAGLTWEDNCRQLKSVIIDTLLSGAHSSEAVKSGIEERRALWADFRTLVKPAPINALSAAFALETSNHNYRIAAARLGCTTHQLYQIIHEG